MFLLLFACSQSFLCPWSSQQCWQSRYMMAQHLFLNFKWKLLKVKRGWNAGLLNGARTRTKAEVKPNFKTKTFFLSHFQILTCQDQKSVCPPKATFFPRDIFKVNWRRRRRGVAQFYIFNQLNICPPSNKYWYKFNIYSPYLSLINSTLFYQVNCNLILNFFSISLPSNKFPLPPFENLLK